MKTSRILFSLILIILIPTKILSAESKPKLFISFGYGYLLNDTKKYVEDTKDYHLYTKFKPAISMEFRQHHLKLDYQNFGYEGTTFESVITDEVTSWDVQDISLKYGHTIFGEKKLKFSAYAGAGLLIWERKYQKNYLKKNTTDYYPTLPLELELRYSFAKKMKLGLYLFNNLNSESRIMGVGVNLYYKLF